ILPPLLKLLMLFPVTEFPVAEIFTFIPVINPVPPVQLLKVFPWMVLVPAPASVFIQPDMVAVPLIVIFEQLLLLLVITLPATEAAELVNKVSAPDAEVLVRANVPTIELPSTC